MTSGAASLRHTAPGDMTLPACHSIKLPHVGDQDYVTCSMVLWHLS